MSVILSPHASPGLPEVHVTQDLKRQSELQQTPQHCRLAEFCPGMWSSITVKKLKMILNQIFYKHIYHYSEIITVYKSH